MAGMKAFCVVRYLCPRSCRGLAAAGKQEGTPSCYQETKTVFRSAVHSQVPPNGRPSVEAERPFSDFPGLLQLQKHNGLPLGCAYSNEKLKPLWGLLQKS